MGCSLEQARKLRVLLCSIPACESIWPFLVSKPLHGQHPNAFKFCRTMPRGGRSGASAPDLLQPKFGKFIVTPAATAAHHYNQTLTPHKRLLQRSCCCAVCTEETTVCYLAFLDVSNVNMPYASNSVESRVRRAMLRFPVSREISAPFFRSLFSIKSLR